MNPWRHFWKNLSAATLMLLGAASAHAVTFTTNTTIACNDLTYDGQDVVVDNGAVLTIACTHSFNSLTVTNGTVTHPAQDTLGLHLIIAGDVIVSASGQINTNGRGYIGTQGPGGAPASGTYASGASHAGVGGDGAGGSPDPNLNCYGSITQPIHFGSGGGSYNANPGGTGGGAIHLEVGDELCVAGSVSANGGSAGNTAGAGAGGSIWLDVSLLSGAGAISANGANGTGGGGGGGGGRIAIYYDTATHTGAVTAYGGSGDQRGGAGSIYRKDNASSNGNLSYDNNGLAGNISRTPGSALLGNLVVAGNAELVIGSSATVYSLTVGANSILRPEAEDALTITVQADATITGVLHATGLGYPGTQGPGGAPASGTYASGGTHGGVGGHGNSNAPDPSLNCYGSITAPVDFGSGGGNYNANPGGVGGGAIHFIVSNTLTVDGALSVNGTGGNTIGGGAGGSLWLEVGSLLGSGAITANGADVGGGGGGGGGGRIAISFDAWSFAGTLSAFGGNGDQRGGAGSVYSKDNAELYGTLSYDNGGFTGNISRSPGSSLLDDVSVVGNAQLVVGSSANVNSLVVGANSILRPEVNDALTFTIQTDATIEGLFHANGLGYPSTQGPGGAPDSPTYASGGSHGGVGGQGNGGTAPNLTCYGSLAQPVDFGSGGGAYPGNPGGSGGGAMHVIVNNLTINGTLSATGITGATHSGGGAGGSLWLEVSALAGSGTISANGGLPSTNGGGGGGGRVAVYYDSWSFNGAITAYGGTATGGQRGGAGSIYLRDNAQTEGNLSYDNGGVTGNISRVPGVSLFDDVSVAGNAELVLGSSASVHSLAVETASILRPEVLDPLTISVATDATIDGTLHATGLGYPSTLGPGGAPDSPTYASGGTHGGVGGQADGGGAPPSLSCYGLLAQPVDFGSGGGSYFGNPAGSGGGAIHLIVSGELAVNGTISARGVTGTTHTGGGAGGSLWLEVSALAGSGTISANGGLPSTNGGGGGGGRVAVYYDSWNFNGAITAYGGTATGGQRGGAGSIFKQASGREVPDLIYDNGGVTGAITRADGGDLQGDLSVAGNTELVLTGAAEINSLGVGANSIIRPEVLTALEITVGSDASIAAAGRVHADALGYPATQGPGGAPAVQTYAGGAAHGGAGGFGNDPNQSIPSHNCYGSIPVPVDFGSGGGNHPSSTGGTGGGVIHLVVMDTLTLEGTLSALGANSGSYSGGGSGGSIWLDVGAMLGAGAISANGGDGISNGGGGGGGRIAVYFDVWEHAGIVSARGGVGDQHGGAGSVYLKNNVSAHGALAYSNGSSNGAVTFVDAADLFDDVTINSNAIVLLSGAGTVHSLEVGSTGVLRPDTLERPDLSVEANALFNGPLSGLGMGFPALQGPGAGGASPSYAAGAAHGGFGGRSSEPSIPTNNAIYGSTVHPQTFGSGGGNHPSGTGGTGGGAVRLRVSDTLTVNSYISMNANLPGSYSGGGSGGSVWINAGTLTGSGTITANGSNGNGDAGGGSGGRIAIYACNLLMSPDSIRALGGDGWEDGGPGTIFIFDPPNDDANNNGQSDQCEVAAGFSDDCNGNQIIDDAEDFGAPQGLTCYHFPGPGVRLLWMCSPNATSYEVYRSTDPNVAIIPGNLIATTTEAEYVDLIPGDPNPPPQFYAVVAVQE